MWITTFIMFTVSTCHLVLQWVGNLNTIQSALYWALARYQSKGSNIPVDTSNYYLVTAGSIANIYLPIINVSFLVSLFLALIDYFAVFVERCNCTLEGMGYVATQRQSLDISCAIFLGNHP